MELSNGALIHYPTTGNQAADLTITLTKPQLLQLLATAAPDGIDMSGDAAVLGRLMSLIDNPDPDFAIVDPLGGLTASRDRGHAEQLTSCVSCRTRPTTMLPQYWHALVSPESAGTYRPDGGSSAEHLAESAGVRPVLCYFRRVNIPESGIFHRRGGSSPPSDTIKPQVSDRIPVLTARRDTPLTLDGFMLRAPP